MGIGLTLEFSRPIQPEWHRQGGTSGWALGSQMQERDGPWSYFGVFQTHPMRVA